MFDSFAIGGGIMAVMMLAMQWHYSRLIHALENQIDTDKDVIRGLHESIERLLGRYGAAPSNGIRRRRREADHSSVMPLSPQAAARRIIERKIKEERDGYTAYHNRRGDT